MKHKLIVHGSGGDVWGECSQGDWAWLGTYVMPKGKREKLRMAFHEHLEYVERSSHRWGT